MHSAISCSRNSICKGVLSVFSDIFVWVWPMFVLFLAWKLRKDEYKLLPISVASIGVVMCLTNVIGLLV